MKWGVTPRTSPTSTICDFATGSSGNHEPRTIVPDGGLPGSWLSIESIPCKRGAYKLSRAARMDGDTSSVEGIGTGARALVSCQANPGRHATAKAIVITPNLWSLTFNTRVVMRV